MTILQNGPDIQCFSQTAPKLRAQFLLLDFQVDQGFQFFFRRTVSVYREYGHHPDGSTVRNLDTFHPDFLLVIWLVYCREPPFLTVLPVCKFEPVRTYPIIIFDSYQLKIGFGEFTKPDFATPAYVWPDGLDGKGCLRGRTRATRGLLWANEGLFLIGKQIDFLAEFICQKKQF